MTSTFTSKILKTALAFSVALCAGNETFAQGTKNPLRTGHNFSGIFANSGQVNAKVNALVSRPGNSQDFEANGTGGWQLQTNSAYTYDSQGRLTQRLYTDPSTGQNVARISINYDSHGVEIGHKTEEWQGTGWSIVDADRTLITYNALGYKQESISQSWRSSINNWENYYREQFTYDSNNLVADITNSEWDNGAWSLLDRLVMNNTGGTATSVLIQMFNGTWQDVGRAQNVTWHIMYEIPSAYITQFKDNGVWVNEERYNAIYDVNGSHVGTYEEWEPQTNSWEKTYRETETYDSNRNYTGWKDETWDPATTSWTVDGEEKEVLTYSGIDITQRVFQDSWGSLSGNLVDREKEVYSNFQTFNISGVKNSVAEIAVNVYPNPAREVLNIAFPEHKGGFTVSVTDVTGKTLLSKTFKTGEANQLNIDALPKGIYLLQLQTETGSVVKRIVKQ